MTDDSGAAHAHHHGHNHHPPTDAPLKALSAALAITAVVFLAELVGGWVTGSMALMADAMHMLSDAAGLIIAVIAVIIGRKSTTAAATYGFRRVEVLAALLNAVTVLLLSVWIVVEAVRRLSSPGHIMAGPMMVIALVGLVANAASAVVLNRQRANSINVEGAFLHVLVDLFGSVAVLAAGAVILFTGWGAADVVASFLIAALVLPRAWQLMNQSVRVLLEQVPPGFDTCRIEPALRAVPGVVDMHDLHLWSLDGNNVLASAHLVVAPGEDADEVLRGAQAELAAFGIGHSTIQIERPGHVSLEGPENVC